jgi:hypothetical protein
MENLDLKDKLETQLKEYVIKSKENLDEKFFIKFQIIM